ncbi:MAG: hypothetical protein QMB82_09160 [Bacteroidales bacterium]|nr:hypothetical protein U5907_02100 [Bacteroidales bacterium MB20-C3-3]
MMDFISIPVTFGVGAYAFYKVIELFVRKRERLLLIDKLNSLENVNTTNINLSEIFGEGKLFKNQYLTLRIGSLLVGLGLGLLIGYIIVNTTMGNVSDATWMIRETQSVIYGASTLLFGGMGLIAGFIAEIRLKKK